MHFNIDLSRLQNQLDAMEKARTEHRVKSPSQTFRYGWRRTHGSSGPVDVKPADPKSMLSVSDTSSYPVWCQDSLGSFTN